jgi:hypothetical protein
MFCLSCGKENAQGSRFCIHCRTSLEEWQVTAPPKVVPADRPAPRRGRGRKVLRGGIAVPDRLAPLSRLIAGRSDGCPFGERSSVTCPHHFCVGTGYDWFPAWSPNGDYLVFQSNRSSNFDIWMIRSDGGNPVFDQPSGRRCGSCLVALSSWQCGIWRYRGERCKRKEEKHGQKTSNWPARKQK